MGDATERERESTKERDKEITILKTSLEDIKELLKENNTQIGFLFQLLNNYIEEEREIRKRKKKSSEKRESHRFVKPTLEVLKAYCEENGLDVDALDFINYYEARGWRFSNGSKMHDWQATAVNWDKRSKDKQALRPEWKREDGGIDWSKV